MVKLSSPVVCAIVVGSPVVGNHRLLLGNPQSRFNVDSRRILSDGEDTDNIFMNHRFAAVGLPVVGNHRLLLGNPQSGFNMDSCRIKSDGEDTDNIFMNHRFAVVGSPVVGNHRLLLGNPQSELVTVKNYEKK
jgi:hypothetical protein